MTEHEWLASADVQAMLAVVTPHIGGTGHRSPFGSTGKRPVSDRKLRLFASAAWRLLFDNERSAARREARQQAAIAERHADDPTGTLLPDTHIWIYQADALAAARDAVEIMRIPKGGEDARAGANLAREVFGNPFRPVKVSRECGVCNGRGKLTQRLYHDVPDNDPSWLVGPRPNWQDIAVYCKECLGNGRIREPWVTPTVLALAEAAYAEAGRRCEACKGRGGCCELKNAEDDRWRKAHTCPDCHGSGRIDDGTLAPHRLAVLADAMEEAGCADEAILRHLRGWEMCPCELERVYGIPMPRPKAGAQMLTCMRCDDGWIKKRAPCVRGCHVVDAILGRS